MATCRECRGELWFVRLDSGTTIPVEPMLTTDGPLAAQRAAGKFVRGYWLTATVGLRPGFVRLQPHSTACSKGRRPARRPSPDADPTPPTLFDDPIPFDDLLDRGTRREFSEDDYLNGVTTDHPGRPSRGNPTGKAPR